MVLKGRRQQALFPPWKINFTPATYTRLLEVLQAAGYAFQTIASFFESSQYKTVLLRHDVDLLPKNALAMAKLEHGMGVVRGSGTPFIFLHSATRLFTHLGFEPFWVNPDSLTETKELRGGSRGIGGWKAEAIGIINSKVRFKIGSQWT